MRYSGLGMREKSSIREKERPMAETWNSGFPVTRGLSHPEWRRSGGPIFFFLLFFFSHL